MSERRTVRDRASGIEITQHTGYKGHSHHFYFTNPGWFDGGRRVLFSSDRCNRTNLYSLDMETGSIEQLTDLKPVAPPREVEFLRACKNPARDEVYFWHDTRLLSMDLASKDLRELCTIGAQWVVSMTNCSADGRFVYFCESVDLSNRFDVDLLRGYVGFREYWQARPRSRIREVAVDSGGTRTVYEEDYWIGHVNASPTRPTLLTFCHEGPWDLVDNRIWALDTSKGQRWRVRPTEHGETVGHEYWYADGDRIGYHGTGPDGLAFLGHCKIDGSERVEARFPGATGHIFSLDERLIVGDGGGAIRVWKLIDGEYRGPRLLCRHDSSMHIQQTHAHPRISPDGRYVLFTSDRSGYGNLYTAPLADFETLPALPE